MRILSNVVYRSSHRKCCCGPEYRGRPEWVHLPSCAIIGAVRIHFMYDFPEGWRFYKKLLFSDDAHFWLNNNKKNYHSYILKNSLFVVFMTRGTQISQRWLTPWKRAFGALFLIYHPSCWLEFNQDICPKSFSNIMANPYLYACHMSKKKHTERKFHVKPNKQPS